MKIVMYKCDKLKQPPAFSRMGLAINRAPGLDRDR